MKKNTWKYYNEKEINELNEVSDAYKIFDNATCHKKILIVPGASHAKSYLKDTKLYEKTVREFLDEID